MKILTISAALLISLGVSQASLAQGKGKGNDNDHGGDKHEGREKGGGQARDDHPGKGGDKHEGRKDDGDRGQQREVKREERVVVVQPDRDRDHDRDRDRVVVVTPDRDRDRDWDRDHDRDWGRDRDRDRVVVVRPPRDWERDLRVVVVNPYDDRRLIRGCPPGLAKKHNGCLPPGQAKKLQARYDYNWLWDRRYDDHAYRYDDGYLYRYDRGGSLLGYMPALGGALSVGSLWPTQYNYYPAPTYYTDYYRLDDPYDYRYADGAIYGVDPKTSAIQQVVALLTGQSFSVGQPMPQGYDIYNVPYAYRSQYIDTPQSAYRYNDGAVYQYDPKTQLIMAVIQLLT